MGIEAGLGRWSIDLRGNYGRQTEESKLLNRVNSARLAVALADTDPATAYNLFGDGPSTNPETIDFIRGSTVSRNRARVWSASLRADGTLVQLPAGEVRVALGGEDCHVLYGESEGITETTTLDQGVRAATTLQRTCKIRAQYGEVLDPVIDD